MVTRTRRSKAHTGEKAIRQELEKRVAQLKALSRGQAIISTSIMDVQCSSTSINGHWLAGIQDFTRLHFFW